MSRLLDGAMGRMSESIKEDLQLARKIVIGMDCWSKRSLTASCLYLAISASFYHPSHHRPVHVVLNVKQIAHPHTGDMLADKLMESLQYWGISKSKVLTIITDNGSNMVKAVTVANEISEEKSDEENEANSEVDDESDEQADEETEGMEREEMEVVEQMANAVNLCRFPCMAHTLQLVIHALTKSQSYSNLIMKVRDLVRFLKVSSVAQEKLISRCGKSVVKDCTTRWNATLMMIDRLLNIHGPVDEVLKELKRDSLTNSEWGRVADLQRLLAPFKEHTDSLQTDTLALSSVIPSILELKLHLQAPSLPRQHADTLLQSLLRRFSPLLDPSDSSFDPLPDTACFLDPTVSAVIMRDDMVPMLTSAMSYIRLHVSSVSAFLQFSLLLIFY